MRRNKKKRIIIIGLIGILALMTAGYAAFQTNLNIKGTSKVSSNWNVLITNVTESNKEGEAETVGTPSWTDLTAYMEANLYQKGDFVEYDVTVENRGTLDAKLDSITDNIKSTNEAVKITFSGYTKGEKLEKGQSQIIKVKIEYNPGFTGTIEEGSGEVSIDLNYTQNDDYTKDEGGTITPTDKYLVTYDCTTNGGNDCSSYNEYLNEGDMVNLNHTSSKEGYEFIGWNTDKDATEALTELTMTNQNITLYAIFKDEPPKCELSVTKATTEDVTIKTTCENEEDISSYNYSINGEEYKTTTNNAYTFNSYNLSTIKVEVTKKSGLKNTFTISDDNLQNAYQSIYDALTEKYNYYSNENDKYEKEFLDKTYPVGSIYTTDTYITVEQITEVFGGTWEEYGKGKALFGFNSNDNNFNQINKTGGSKTTTLAVTNLPAHTHSIPALSGTAASAGAHTHSLTDAIMKYSDALTGNKGLASATGAHYTNFYSGKITAATYSAGAHTHSVTTTANTTGSIGNGTAFTNLPPYTTVYMYKRVS